VLIGQRQSRRVTTAQQVGFAAAAAMPYGSDRVDHMGCGQPERASRPGLSGRTAADRPALGQEVGARGAVYGTINPAATEQ